MPKFRPQNTEKTGKKRPFLAEEKLDLHSQTGAWRPRNAE